MRANGPFDCDVLIVGGGTPALFLAHQLGVHPDRPSVVVLERGAEGQRARQGVLVHPVSQALLEDCLPHRQWAWTGTVERIQEYSASNRLSDVSVGSCNPDGVDRLPANTQLSEIDDVLVQELNALPNVAVVYGASVDDAQDVGEQWLAHVARDEGALQVRARMLVAADGRESSMRDVLGIRYVRTPFPGEVTVSAFADRRPEPSAISMVVADHGVTTVVDNGMGPNTLVFNMHVAGHRDDDQGEAMAQRSAIAGLSLSSPHEPLFTAPIPSATVTCDRWCIGSALVFGDAAHAMHNMGGQGFNLSLQDAVVLAGCIVAGLRGDQTLMRQFEEFRLPYVSDLQDYQNQFFRRLQHVPSHAAEDRWFERVREMLIDGQPGLHEMRTQRGGVVDA